MADDEKYPIESQSMNTTFERNPTGITGHGQRYEVYLAFWLLLNGLQRKDQFYMCCNVVGFGNFDDIVFKYKLNEEYHLILLQLKHRNSQDLKTGDLVKKRNAKENLTKADKYVRPINKKLLLNWKLLVQCYNSYLNIEARQQCNILEDVKNENIHYIIFTNGRWNCRGVKFENEKSVIEYLSTSHLYEEEIRKISHPIQLDNDDFNECVAKAFKYFANDDIYQGKNSKLLKILQEDKYYGKKTPSELKKILTASDEENILNLLDNDDIGKHFDKKRFKEFLSKLIICQKQPREDTLGAFLQDKIADMGEEDSKRAYDDIVGKMTKWHESSNNALTQKNFYQILENDVHHSKASFLAQLDSNENAYLARTITNSQNDTIIIDKTFDPKTIVSPLILAGGPGEGKSTILNYLSQFAKNNLNVIKIKLARLSLKFEEEEGNENDSQKITCDYIFRKILTYQNEEKYSKINRENFYILLDGYDEIFFRKDEIIEIINQCIQTLAANFNILISTRKSFEIKLEELINGTIYHIKKMNSDDQKQIAKHFFKMNDKDIQPDDDTKLNNMINDIFEIYNNVHLAEGHDPLFLAIPLQLEMFLQLFADEFPRYCKSPEDFKLDFQFKSVSDFYEKFVNKKIDLYLKRINMSSAPAFDKQKIRERIHNDHIRYAFIFLRHYGVIEQIEFTLSENELIGIGFAKRLNFDRKLMDFVHQTFAEYFFALGLLAFYEKFEGIIIESIERGDFLGNLLSAKYFSKTQQEFDRLNAREHTFSHQLPYKPGMLRFSPLHTAILFKNKAEKVRRHLIANRMFINQQNRAGITPLHCAVHYGLYHVVDELIQIDECNINLVDSYNRTGLHWAIKDKRNDIAKLLLSHPKCDISRKGEWDKSVVEYAIYFNNIEILELLLTKPNCDINSVNDRNQTALYYALNQGHIKVATWLLSKPNCDITIKDFRERTALHYAVEYQLTEIVQLLMLNPNCDINSKDCLRQTPLHYAIENKNAEIVELLMLNPNCDMNSEDDLRKTPLHYAIENKNAEIVKILLSSPNCHIHQNENHLKHFALFCANGDENDEIVQLLLSPKRRSVLMRLHTNILKLLNYFLQLFRINIRD